MSKFVDVIEKVVTNSKIKTFKFDRSMSSFCEKPWEYFIIFDLTHDILL
jgi:hypothetical protein